MEDLKNFFNIIFFIVMGAVAILSYIQARKTLFSPIKTEIFKVQIDEFKSVLAFFNKRSSTDFDEEFDLCKVLELNALKMQLDYITLFFPDELKPSDEILKILKTTGHGMLVSQKHASKYFEVITPGSELKEPKDAEDKEKNLPPANKLAKWNDYILPGVEYTKKFTEKSEELSMLAASPLLPKGLTNLLYDFHKVIHQNLVEIGEQVETAAKQMPTKYPTAQDAAKFNPNWVWNEFNHQRESTREPADKILAFVNEHLKINEIMQ